MLCISNNVCVYIKIKVIVQCYDDDINYHSGYNTIKARIPKFRQISGFQSDEIM